MKYFFIVLMMTTVALAASKTPKKNLPINKAEEIVKADKKKTGDKAQAILTEEEDCDEKAKKVVEIEPETFTLGGNTGCSLDDL